MRSALLALAIVAALSGCAHLDPLRNTCTCSGCRLPSGELRIPRDRAKHIEGVRSYSDEIWTEE